MSTNSQYERIPGRRPRQSGGSPPGAGRHLCSWSILSVTIVQGRHSRQFEGSPFGAVRHLRSLSILEVAILQGRRCRQFGGSPSGAGRHQLRCKWERQGNCKISLSFAWNFRSLCKLRCREIQYSVTRQIRIEMDVKIETASTKSALGDQRICKL